MCTPANNNNEYVLECYNGEWIVMQNLQAQGKQGGRAMLLML
jgi:hypothetical protein